MWNPPLIDKATGDPPLGALGGGRPARRAGRRQGVRTICFLNSRRGIELIQRFAREALEERGRPELATRIAPYRGGYTPQQRREIEARLAGGRAARGRRDRRARARDRHRRARRGDLRHLPGHRRQPAADVGAGGPAERGARRLRRRPGRARPVLLPPSGRVPRAAGRGGDPRPRERADPLAHLLAAAYELPLSEADDGVPRAALARARRGAWSRPGGAPARDARAATCRADRDFPAARDLAALGLAGLGRGHRARLGRAARGGRGRAGVHHRPPRRGLPAPGSLLRGP